MKKLTLKQVQELPVIRQSHFDNLIKEYEHNGTKYRVWVSRCTKEDGMPYNNQITVEKFDETNGYTWTIEKQYEPK